MRSLQFSLFPYTTPSVYSYLQCPTFLSVATSHSVSNHEALLHLSPNLTASLATVSFTSLVVSQNSLVTVNDSPKHLSYISFILALDSV